MNKKTYETPHMNLILLEMRQNVAVTSNGFEISNFTDEGDLFGDEVL